jgi:hypothetical protein
MTAFVCLVWMLACSCSLCAQSCLLEGTVFGRPAKECLTNVSVPKDAFDGLCRAWEKSPDPSIQSKTTYVNRCPDGYAGYCEATFPGADGKTMKHYFYNKATVARAKKACSPTNPISPGVWHDQSPATHSIPQWLKPD